ncbi:ParB/RepB/Spo0J family partition protein [Streptomyces kanamyceticus]|uniref:ParB/RepB/Spo0J family partition protein n=1 Tax=Streptomyces kanamyceticus TaxID=1967 RepID=UPI0006E1C747|nr:ParB N-terminal domain-containing protein [Streptomyces kanamyceticus]
MRVPLDLLLPAVSPRIAGVDERHVRSLAGIEAPLPPIVVHRATLRVIDGTHRLLAARARGETDVEVQFFDGGEADAFVLAVALNNAQGLALSPADRSTAAARIIASHPHWSDRRIARVTGLAASTVGGVRRRSTARTAQPNARLGMDGRIRPQDIAQRRRLAGQFLAEQPGASLRTVAKAAGISLSTAHDVRTRLRAGDDPLPPALSRPTRPPAAPDSAADAADRPAKPSSARSPRSPGRAPVAADLLDRLRKDPSLRFTEDGRILLHWLGAAVLREHGAARFARCVPPHRTAAMAALARSCAEGWLRLAESLDQRGRSDA